MKTALILILSFSFWIVTGEYLSLFLTKRYSDGLDKAKVLLEPHPVYGWLQKKNYQGTFIDKKVSINQDGFRVTPPPKKPSSTGSPSPLRVLVLGPSSAFGWGVANNETYASFLPKELRNKIKRPIEVINASQIGYSSFQGKLLAKNHQAFKGYSPDIVIFAYGVNDIDRHRFFFQSPSPDSDYLIKEVLEKNFQREHLLNSFHTIRLINRQVGKVVSRLGCPNLTMVPKRRVSLSDFTENLMAIKKHFNRPVLIVNTAHAYKADISVSYFNDTDLENLTKLDKVPLGEFTQSKNSHYFYKLALMSSTKGECDLAWKYFDSALKFEEYRISADLKKINSVLEATTSNSEDYYLVDAYKRLLVPHFPMKYFVDPIHPNAEGHQLIAVDIAKVILENKLHESEQKQKNHPSASKSHL